MIWPEDSIQYICDEWWVKTEDKDVCRGRLIKAHLAHVDQEPLVMVPTGRKDPEDHGSAYYKIKPLRQINPSDRSQLPVAGLPTVPGEERFVYRNKKRLALLICVGGECIPKGLRVGSAKWRTSVNKSGSPIQGN